MNREIWKRLLWKEWRENWLYLVVGVGVPLAAMMVFKHVNKDYRTAVINISYLLSIIFIVVCTTTQANSKMKNKKNIQNHLPVNESIIHFYNFIIPMIIPVLIGVSLGQMRIIINSLSVSEYYYINLPTDKILTDHIFLMLSYYMLIAIVTQSFSWIQGLLSGLIFFIIILISSFYYIGLDIVQIAWFITGITTAYTIWEYCLQHNREIIGRVLVILILLASYILPLDIIENLFNNKMYEYDKVYYEYQIDNYNNTRHVYINEPDKNGYIKLVYDDNAKKIHREHLFKKEIAVAVIMENDTGILIEQADKYGIYTHLLRWQPENDTVTKIKDIPKHWGKVDFVYPSHKEINNNYIIYQNHNPMIGNMDIWIIDMLNGKAKLLAVFSSDNGFLSPGSNRPVVKWETDKVSYCKEDRKIVVLLPSLQIIEEKLPIEREIE